MNFIIHSLLHWLHDRLAFGLGQLCKPCKCLFDSFLYTALQTKETMPEFTRYSYLLHKKLIWENLYSEVEIRANSALLVLCLISPSLDLGLLHDVSRENLKTVSAIETIRVCVFSGMLICSVYQPSGTFLQLFVRSYKRYTGIRPSTI